MLSRRRPRRESGQVVVLFALLVPIILTLGSIVVSAGNWYVLKRHLQTQVDMAALAGGQGFLGCGQDPAAASADVSTTALKYSGDTLRSRDLPAGPLTTPYNLQLEDAGDQRVVLNSPSYWPSLGTATDGTNYDYKDVSTAGDAPKLGEPGSPCYNGYLDVKATDNEAPLLFRWIPLFPSPKSHARVELQVFQGGEGLRPIGVPEVDPEVVAVLIVDENAAGGVNDPGAIRNPPDQRILDEVTPVPAGLAGMHVYRNTTPFNAVDLGGGSQDFRVVVVTSRDPGFIPTGSLQAICTGNPTQTFCYDYDGSLSGGISFIHAYNGGGGSPSATSPVVRDVTLSGGCGVSDPPAVPSNPYFNVDDGATCGTIGMSATIDFGPGLTDPTLPQPNGVCAEVTATGMGDLTYVSGVWTGVFTPAIASGANQINITTTTDTTGGCAGGNNPSDTFNKVAKPYVADEDSGPVQYLSIEHSPGGGPANSINKTTSASLTITVGFTPLLKEADPFDDPIPLRIWNTPSQSQTLDCQTSGASGWADAMEFGCVPYQIYNPAWHTSACGPPPVGVPPADPPDCIASQNGNYQQSVAHDLWASPCSATPNNWYQNGYEVPPGDDPRWIPLFIVDEKSFLISGKKYWPVRRFGGFYVTAGNSMGCPGDDPDPLPASTKRSIYGHFVTYLPDSGGQVIPSGELCSFTEGGLCVPVLVE
ncbi:MAG TPA: pilus assembly protein TadG-related protein [Gaiellaceae bacterium]|nr:pilus assembly protein TadG-related protein [Gaiellaceae bacterium]